MELYIQLQQSSSTYGFVFMAKNKIYDSRIVQHAEDSERNYIV